MDLNKLSSQDDKFMNLALDAARKAEALGEVPIGAVVIHNNHVISSGYNLRETACVATQHAELIAIEAACKALGRWRLHECQLYVTLEPCLMCAGAIVLARLDRIVYGATDTKAGAVKSLYQVLGDARLNHRPIVEGGILETECSTILRDFFARKRQEKSSR